MRVEGQNRANFQSDDSLSPQIFFLQVRTLAKVFLHRTHREHRYFHPGLEPDSFTYASIGSEGGKLTLPDWGVSLLVPRGALEPGYLEEVFQMACIVFEMV